MPVKWDERAQRALIQDVDDRALIAAADNVVPLAKARGPVLKTPFPRGNVHGPAGRLVASVGRTEPFTGVYGRQVEVGAAWYGIFPIKAGQVKHPVNFLGDALADSKALI